MTDFEKALFKSQLNTIEHVQYVMENINNMITRYQEPDHLLTDEYLDSFFDVIANYLYNKSVEAKKNYSLGFIKETLTNRNLVEYLAEYRIDDSIRVIEQFEQSL